MEQKNTRHNEDRLLAPFHGPALKAMRQTMGDTQEAFAAASGIWQQGVRQPAGTAGCKAGPEHRSEDHGLCR